MSHKQLLSNNNLASSQGNKEPIDLSVNNVQDTRLRCFNEEKYLENIRNY